MKNKSMDIHGWTGLIVSSVFLTACGGGGGEAADVAAPAISAVSASIPGPGQVALTVSASDDKGVAAYCVKTASATPTASDSCFVASAITSIPTPAQPTRYYAWVKDAAGNISNGFERVAGPCSEAGVIAAQATSLPVVCVGTSLGQFVLELEAIKAPITTTNFLKYVNDDFYSQTVFHRVLSTFMIQGGGFTGVPIGTSTAKSGTLYPPIQLETTTTTGLSNTVGTIAMARTNVLDSATNQFFINVVDNTFLNTSSGGYAVFGRVISGLDTTVQSIRAVPVQSNGSEVSQPLVPPLISWAYQFK